MSEGITVKLTGAISCKTISTSICTKEKQVPLGKKVLKILWFFCFSSMPAPARCGAHGQLEGKSGREKITGALLKRWSSCTLPETPRHFSFRRSQPSTACCVPLDTTSILRNTLSQLRPTAGLCSNPWPLGGSVASPMSGNWTEKKKGWHSRARHWTTIIYILIHMLLNYIASHWNSALGDHSEIKSKSDFTLANWVIQT